MALRVTAGLALHIQFHSGLKALVVADGKQPHIGLIEATGNLIEDVDGDLLDQPHLVGVYRSQAVKQIDFSRWVAEYRSTHRGLSVAMASLALGVLSTLWGSSMITIGVCSE